MNMFEFQFRRGGKRSSFGVDVNAPTIDEAVTKANRFFNSDVTGDERRQVLVSGPQLPHEAIGRAKSGLCTCRM